MVESTDRLRDALHPRTLRMCRGHPVEVTTLWSCADDCWSSNGSAVGAGRWVRPAAACWPRRLTQRRRPGTVMALALERLTRWLRRAHCRLCRDAAVAVTWLRGSDPSMPFWSAHPDCCLGGRTHATRGPIHAAAGRGTIRGLCRDRLDVRRPGARTMARTLASRRVWLLTSCAVGQVPSVGGLLEDALRRFVDVVAVAAPGKVVIG